MISTAGCGLDGSFSPFAPRLPDDGPRGVQEKNRHEATNDKVGPCRSEIGDGAGRPDDAEIADDVVARTKPDRTHVDVVAPVLMKKHEARRIADER